MITHAATCTVQESPPDDVPFDERELVERARHDANAFAELYRRHVGAIHVFVYRRTGSREVAEDLTSATFERALMGIDGFKWRPGGVAPWLFRIASNQVIDHHRRRGRHSGERAQRAAQRLHEPVSFDTEDAIDSLLDADRMALVREALDRLNPRYQRVLSLRYLSGLGHEESARAMGVSMSLMSVLTHRATKALGRELEKLQREES